MESEEAITDKPLGGKPQLKLYRIYTKSSSFEAMPLTIALIESSPQPITDLQVHVNFYPQNENIYEAVLALQIDAKHSGGLLWRIQLQQAGLYFLQEFKEEEQKQALYGFCMNQLYPYACAAVTNLIIQGGFAPVYLSPLNFEQIYRERKNAAVKIEEKIK